MKIKLFATLLLGFLMSSCGFNDIYFQYSAVAKNGWSKDSCYVFRVPVTDTVSVYNIYVNVRNRENYPYQNLWLFLKMQSPDMVRTKDSIECFLADQRGKWLGSGIGSVMEMPLIYRQKVRFSKPGIYRFDIGHGMRDSVLVGINDIGLRIEKSE